jgi:hypothetical protein
MHKWLLISCLSVGLTVGAMGLQTAQAQHGLHGHCHTPSYHSHYGGYSVGYARPSLSYSSRSMGYSPYGLGGAYGTSLRYGSLYGAPGLGVGRSSFYSGGLPYGIGGYGGSMYGVPGIGIPGMGFPRGPGLQMRLGF